MLAEKQNEGKEEEEAYEFVVVGAGPAGLTAVATLIDHGVTRIAWIDDSFVGGRLGEKYREIPSNTKIRLFLDYVAASSTLTKLVQEETSEIAINSYTTLKELDQDRGNRLSYAADLMVMSTRRITSTHFKINNRLQGRVKSLELVNGVDWMVKMDYGMDQQPKILKTKSISTGVAISGCYPLFSNPNSTNPPHRGCQMGCYYGSVCKKCHQVATCSKSLKSQ
ncbi:hypothetical protein Pst134EB_020596 [Puccinia striiformis f. sp. tritici]|uniref:FAD/NAD(P)-binding domain-containing protein n=2 Tax=Puccinia striiformis f. sp. tritici TaxID=168172 RepID=A0A0L0UXR2_9BASI|nr:hypothetical protein Pst134EB_020596 [Puccinia striiformis f. sp. tritici]KNE91838.1 hypothetical protein PSTG_14744 [Puccinia striiformis f. sp. tritici PST-78]